MPDLTEAEQITLAKYGPEKCIKAYEAALRLHANRRGGFDHSGLPLSLIGLVGRKLKTGS